MDKQAEFIKALNLLLKKEGFNEQLKSNHLIFRSEHVEDSTDYKITRFLNGMLPASCNEGSFYHFTKASTIDSMLNSDDQSLRITSIGKNISIDEVSQSLETAGVDYLLQPDPISGKPRFHKFYESNVYIASFISAPLAPEEESLLWAEFGQGGHGARLRFKIKCDGGFFRPMSYNPSNKSFKTYASINHLSQKILGKKFYWDDSVLAFAMALPLRYEPERETRLILRRNDTSKIFKDDKWDYIKLPIDGRTAWNGLSIELDEISTNHPVPDAYKNLVVSPH